MPGDAGAKAEFDEAWCYEMLRRIRWPDGIICPFCGRGRVTTHSKSVRTPRRRYLCLGCRQTFTDLRGTPFARTNLPMGKWLVCLRLLRHGQTTADLARVLNVKWDTAVQLQRRLRVALTHPGIVRQLRDVVEKAENA